MDADTERGQDEQMPSDDQAIADESDTKGHTFLNDPYAAGRVHEQRMREMERTVRDRQQAKEAQSKKRR